MIQLQAGLQVGPLHGPGARFRSPSSSACGLHVGPLPVRAGGAGPVLASPVPLSAGAVGTPTALPFLGGEEQGQAGEWATGQRAEGRRGEGASQAAFTRTSWAGPGRAPPPRPEGGGRGPTC